MTTMKRKIKTNMKKTNMKTRKMMTKMMKKTTMKRKMLMKKTTMKTDYIYKYHLISYTYKNGNRIAFYILYVK